MVVFIPGLGRTAKDFEGWLDRLPGAQVLPIPGFDGTAPLPEPTIAAFVDHFAERLAPGSFVVGESLGGLIALGLAERGFPGIAVDPPLTTAKQWSLYQAMQMLVAKMPDPTDFVIFLENVFGFMSDGTIEDRIYYPMLKHAAAPFTIVTGHLMAFPVNGQSLPCMVDAVDAYLIRSTEIDLVEVIGGHVLLSESADALEDLIRAKAGL
jgi:pimeloyl-ACP methyl ester carboxylesterase